MFVVDPVARGQRLASFIMKGALDDLATRGYAHVLSLSARPIPYVIQQRGGWRIVTNYDPHHRESRKRRLKRVLRERAPAFMRAWRSLRRHRSGRIEHISGQRSQAFVVLEDALPDSLDGGTLKIARKPEPAAMAELAEMIVTEGYLRHVRTAEYFSWRYDAPLMDYRFLTWSKGSERGFLVLETGRGAKGWTRLFDWEATSVEVLMRLVDASIKFGRFDRIWTSRAELPVEMDRFLRTKGFVPSDESMGVAGYEPGMMVKALANGKSEGAWEVHGLRLDEAANWSLRPSYSI